eukprot:CAMPEP_0203675970 /NCGR_PEP_ID=MMETSP0090-20130426/22792_1 /ASSEMBLY_ACC=CAM_ASM_001088 /TAXON_ID=426623 /ORGANISM="Chaetoceros affinis, Strain CCMP159" /LENGTH=235 /DNA_ID=CAMNT_0050542345 /DNA_START=115 /DNA_END=822 /DNA_ORIENTATION=-
MTSENPKITISYFPIGGRAEPIRLACAVSKIPFTNKVMSFPEFKEAKSTLPLGQLPILELDYGETKKTLTQSTAMLRWIGKIGGLYPKDDDVTAMEIDEILTVLDDLREPLVLTVRGKVKALLSDDTEFTGEEKLAIRERWMKNTLPRFLGFIEKKLTTNEGSKWIVGNDISIADLALYCELEWISGGILDGIPTSVLDTYPACLTLMENVKTNERIKSWKDKYSKPYSNFDYEP